MRYGIIENSKCVNVIVAQADFAESIGAVEMADGYGIGDRYEDGVWSHPEPEPPKPTPDNERDAMIVDLEYRTTILELGL